MPIVNAVSGAAPAVTDLAATLAAQINDGRSGRASVGAQDQAFAWTTGAPSVLALAVNSVLVEGRSFEAVLVAPSGTPAAKVAEGAAKPIAVTLTSETVTLAKYAGIGSFSTEQALGTDSLVPAVYATLFTGALLAFDLDCIAALAAAAPVPVTGATWTAAILAGFAEVASRGGAMPDLLVMSGADYAAAVEAPGAGYVLSPLDAVPTLFGLRIVVSGAAPVGTAYVLSSAAMTVGEAVGSPYVLVDPYSGAGTNVVRVVAELFANVIVNAPGQVAAVGLAA